MDAVAEQTPPPPARLEPALEIDDLHVAVDDREILRGVSLAVEPGPAPRPHGPERLRASRRSPTRCSATPPTRSPAGRILLARHDITDAPDRRARRAAASSSASSTPRRSRASRCSTSCARRSRTARASTTTPCSRSACSSSSGRSAWAWTPASRSATSTRDSPAARRSATRCCRWRCSNPMMAVLDETDSGLDIDALRQVAAGIEEIRKERAAARHPARSRTTNASSTTCAPTSCTC